jgi:hypothetical protein
MKKVCCLWAFYFYARQASAGQESAGKRPLLALDDAVALAMRLPNRRYGRIRCSHGPTSLEPSEGIWWPPSIR